MMRRAALLFPIALAVIAAAPAHPLRAIRFAPGQTVATVRQSVERGAGDTWSFAANAGQTADVRITSVESNASFVIYAPGAKLTASDDDSGLNVEGDRLPGGDPTTPALDAGAQKHWRGVLPKTGTYYITVAPDRGGASYQLTLSIPK
jgi:hypothetical protein